jgi:carbonic anhydrase/acetyltransferase-like protein (isoleucine patch superfamily)
VLIEHRGKRPRVDPSAYVAPTAVICGDVTIGTESRVLFGAVVTAEGGPVSIGEQCIVMEQAVVRGTRRHPARIGNHVLIGPRASLSGCTIEDRAFIATGATIFNGARVGVQAEVRVNGVVHVRSVVPDDATVPIGWVAVGDPAQILPPNEHDRIWTIQRELDFPGTVWGLPRAPEGGSIMLQVTERYARALAAHLDDVVLEDPI